MPAQPIREGAAGSIGAFWRAPTFPWVLKLYEHLDLEHLIGSVRRRVIRPAEAKASGHLLTPLLPFHELAAWSDGLETPAVVHDPARLAKALEADRAILRARLAIHT